MYLLLIYLYIFFLPLSQNSIPQIMINLCFVQIVFKKRIDTEDWYTLIYYIYICGILVSSLLSSLEQNIVLHCLSNFESNENPVVDPGGWRRGRAPPSVYGDNFFFNYI